MDVSFSLETINEAAQTFLNITAGKKVIALHGEMGAGKTTFVHAVCDILQVKNSVSSPTFSIINEYTSAEGKTLKKVVIYFWVNRFNPCDTQSGRLHGKWFLRG